MLDIVSSQTSTIESYVEVLGVDIRVLGKVVVLLGHEYTLLEEVLVDLLSVCLWDKPASIDQPLRAYGC